MLACGCHHLYRGPNRGPDLQHFSFRPSESLFVLVMIRPPALLLYVLRNRAWIAASEFDCKHRLAVQALARSRRLIPTVPSGEIRMAGVSQLVDTSDYASARVPHLNQLRVSNDFTQ